MGKIMITRRKILKNSIAAAGMTLAAPAFLTTQASAAGALELNTLGTLTSAAEGTYAPFSFLNKSGKNDGIGYKTMQEIAKRLDLEYNPVVTKWESLLIGVLANKFDISASAMGINSDRQKQVFFCDAWVESGSKLFVHKDSPYQSSADVNGKKVGAIVASIFIPVAEKLVGSDGSVPVYQADVEGMMDVSNGNIDGVILDAVAASYAITVSKLPLRGMPNLEQSYQLGWAANKSKPNLVKAINEKHWEMVKDGTFAAICDPLIGFDPTPSDPIRTIFS
jgi:polar amino acid transport system substrate-binding protein